MDDDLAITLGILLAVDEATATRIAQKLGVTFGDTAGKGANTAFDKAFKGGGKEAGSAGAKAGKEYSKGFASQMRALEKLIKEAAKRITTAQRIEAEAAAAQERSIMRSREKAFADSLARQTKAFKEEQNRQTVAFTAAVRAQVGAAAAADRARVAAVKTAGKVISDTNKAQQQRDTDTNRSALRNGENLLKNSLASRLAATRTFLAQTLSATEHANRQTTANVTAAARQRVIVTETTGKVINNAAKAQQQRDTDTNRAALTNGTKVLDAALDVRTKRWKSYFATLVNDADHANRRTTNADNANARDRSIRLDSALSKDRANNRYDRQGGIDRSREKGFENLSGVRRSNNEAENLYRSSNAKILADAKRHNASMIAADQQAGVRRTAYIRTALNNLTRVNQSVMTAILTAWRSHHQRRLADESSANRKAEIELQASMDRRLAKIKAGAQQQSLAATANASASERANTALSGGVLGAATGRGMGVASLFAGAFGGREIFNILGDFQNIETAFKGIFREVDGGAPRTTQFLKDMQAFARETPFTLSQVSLAAQKMFAARLVNPEDADATEQLTEKLRRLADAASATGKNASQMDAALLGITQIQGTGFMMEELRQVTENIGLPMDEVAKSLGMSVKEMKDAMKEGSIGVKEGLDAIFDAMTRIPGAAGASARQAKTLRGAMSQLRDVGEQLVIKFLMPVGVAFGGMALAIGKVGDQLLSGKGAWKVARDGLQGIVGALTAIIAVKGAVGVIKLLGIGLSAIAAAPVTAALVALVGVLSTFDGLRAKLASLVEGTKNWFLVGYRANVVIDSFSGFVKVITTVGKFARTIKDFTTALVVGTKDWFLVGYRIGGVIDEFSNIVLFQSSLGAAARVIKDALGGIWDALGTLAQTRDFGEFRKALGKVAEDAGKALSPIKDALAEQFSKGVDAAKAAAGKAVKAVIGWVGDNMDSLVAGARVASGGALILRMLGLAKGGNFLGMARLGIAGIVASLVIYIGKELASSGSKEELSRRLTTMLTGAFDAAIVALGAVGQLAVNLTSHISEMFKVAFRGAKPESAAGEWVQSIVGGVGGAINSLKERISNIGKSVGEALTTGFGDKLIELPYQIGEKISSTAVSAEVLAVLGGAIVAAGTSIALLGAQVAAGLYTGFRTGLTELAGSVNSFVDDIFGADPEEPEKPRRKRRRSIVTKTTTKKEAEKEGESIAGWLIDGLVRRLGDAPYAMAKAITSFALDAELIKAIGSVSTALAGAALALGAALVVKIVQGMATGFVEAVPAIGDMVVGAFSELGGFDIGANFAGLIGLGIVGFFAKAKIFDVIKKPFSRFSIGYNADSTRDARIGIAKLKTEMDGTGSKAGDLGMKVARISDAAGKATSGLANLTERSGQKMQELGAQAAGVQGKFQSAGGAIIQAGKSTNAATFVGFGGAGSNMEKFRGIVGRAMVAVGGRIEKLPEQIRAVGAKARKGWDLIGGGANAASAAVGVGVAAITAYYTSMSDDTATQVTGVLASLGQIAAAWAIGGPTLGPILAGVTALSAGIGMILGNAAKNAKKDAAALKEVEDAAKRAGDTYADALMEFGTTDGGRMAASWKVINTAIEDTEGKLQGISDSFGISFGDVAKAIAGGGDAVTKFQDKVLNSAVADLMDRDTEALLRFGDAYSQTVEGTSYRRTPENFGFSFAGDEAAKARLKFMDLNGALRNNEISINEWAEEALSLGADAKAVAAEVENLKGNLTGGVRGVSGFDAYFATLAGDIDAAIAKNKILVDIQEQFRASQERLLSPIERMQAAWDRVKEKIDKASAAFRGYLDSVLGRESTIDQTIISLSERALTDAQGKQEGETDLTAGARLRENERQALYDAMNVVGRFAEEANGDASKLNASMSEFFKTLIDGATNEGTKQFYRDLQNSPLLAEAMMKALATTDPIENMTDISDAWGEFVADADNKPIIARIEEAPNFTEQQNAIMAAVMEMVNEDPAIKTFIEEGPGYKAVFESILVDKGLLGIGVTVPVSLTPSGRMKEWLDKPFLERFGFGSAGEDPTIPVQPTIPDSTATDLQTRLDDIFADSPLKVKVEVEVAPALALARKAISVVAGRQGTKGVKENYNGGLETSPVLSTLAERGAEAIFPLTNPARMRQIMGIPQVARAFDAAGFGAPITGNAANTNYAPVSVDQSQVNHFEIHESSPRMTADEIFRRQRKARFHGGHTLPVVIR